MPSNCFEVLNALGDGEEPPTLMPTLNHLCRPVPTLCISEHLQLLNESDFEKHKASTRPSYTAGILPFCIDSAGEVQFILGRERFTRNWRGSSHWCAFEGGSKAGEDHEATAAREFMEETMSCLATWNGNTQAEIAQSLRQKQYSLRLNMLMLSGSESGVPEQRRKRDKLHVIFIIKVPCPGKEVMQKFQEKRNYLLRCRRSSSSVVDDMSAAIDPLLEKDCIRCWSVAELTTVCHCGGILDSHKFRFGSLPYLWFALNRLADLDGSMTDSWRSSRKLGHLTPVAQ